MQTTIMKQSGFIVEQATNGYEAFQMVAKTIENKKQLYSLILLDLNMPI